MRVKNDIKEIEKVLHLDNGSTQNEGNFIFSGKMNGHCVMVITELADGEKNEINISSIEIAELPEEPKTIKVTTTFQTPDNSGCWTESCFTVSVRGTLNKEERDDIINQIAPDMAKLQGLPGTNVTVVSIEEDK